MFISDTNVKITRSISQSHGRMPCISNCNRGVLRPEQRAKKSGIDKCYSHNFRSAQVRQATNHLTPKMISFPHTMDVSFHSLGSTITVHPEGKSQYARCQKKQRTARRVTFQEDANKYYTNTMRCAEDCVESWYASEDYKAFRAYAQKLAQIALEAQQAADDKFSFFDALELLHKFTRKIDFSLQDIRSELSQDTMELLKNMYISKSQSDLIGLEYYIIASIKKDAMKRRMFLQDTVQEVQHEQDMGLYDSAEAAQTELRDSCLAYTQTSALFAQLLALAQDSTN